VKSFSFSLDGVPPVATHLAMATGADIADREIDAGIAAAGTTVGGIRRPLLQQEQSSAVLPLDRARCIMSTMWLRAITTVATSPGAEIVSVPIGFLTIHSSLTMAHGGNVTPRTADAINCIPEGIIT
jgi:hypothetical protein